MSIVAGVDFGTQSVRVSLFSSGAVRLGSGVAENPVIRSAQDPMQATQSHAAQMEAFEHAVRRAIEAAGVDGGEARALAVDTAGSSVIPVDDRLQPLDDYALWCDHRAWREAQEITEKAHALGLEAIDWCGGAYSSEWGFAKLLHWLRHNPGKRERLATALENCDMVAATLCGITSVAELSRSVCAMGRKWMWNSKWDGLPPEAFLVAIDPLLGGVRAKLAGKYATSDHIAGGLSEEWARRLSLRPGIPVPVGALDAHWDAVGANIRLGDVTNVIGTSTCIIGEETTLVRGVCGVVPGSVLPGYTGIEAGLSSVGEMFDGIARRAGKSLEALTAGPESHRGGQTGLLRMAWDNGDRTILVNPNLGGVTLGWNPLHTPEDRLFAAIEGTALHTRIILERMAEKGSPVHRVINGGGIPRRNNALNRVYANALNRPVMVPCGDVTSLGSAIFAFLASGDFNSIEEAQTALCPANVTFAPDAAEAAVYDRLYRLYRDLYFSLGQPNSDAVRIGHILPRLREIAAESQTLSREAQ